MTDRQLSEAEFRVTVDQVAVIGSMLAAIDAETLELCVRTVEYSENVGPILDPTAFLGGDAFDRLRQQRQLLNAAIAFRRVVVDLQHELTS